MIYMACLKIYLNMVMSSSTGSNALRTSQNYGWTWVLNGLKTGNRIVTLNDASDAALLSQKDAFSQTGIVYSVLNFLATFNANISVPDLNQAVFQSVITSPVPEITGNNPEVKHNITFTGPVSTLTMRKTDTNIWKLVLLCFQVLKGRHYIPKDSEFDYVWSYFKNSSTATFTFADMIAYVLTHQKNTTFNSGDSTFFLTDARTITFNPRLDTTNKVFLSAYNGLEYLQNESNPAFTITRRTTTDATGAITDVTFSMKMRINAYSDTGNVWISNLGFLKWMKPFQPILHAHAMNALVGSLISVEASNYVASGHASNAGSDLHDVSFVHVGYDAAVNNYLTLGFRVTAVEKVRLVDESLLLVLTVVDSQTRNNSPTLRQTLSYTPPSPPAPNASTPAVVVACSDPELEINLSVVIPDVYSRQS